VGKAGNRDAIGALVEIESQGSVQKRLVMPTRSYLSQVELPVTFGLGDATTIDRVTIRWPDGSVQDVPGVALDRLLVVEQTR